MEDNSTETLVVSCRLSVDDVEAIDEIAKGERRTRANTVAILIQDALKARKRPVRRKK